MGNSIISLPPQQLPFSRKTKVWRKQHLDWASNKTYYNYNPIRKSVMHKKINYDLLNGKLHMSDLLAIINPEGMVGGFVPDNIQHYPIMNSKLNVLRGEEVKRVFDYHVVVTNPNAVSEIEEQKKQILMQQLQQLIEDKGLEEEGFNMEMEKLNKFMLYEYQDHKELAANEYLRHYWKEYNMPIMFNHGFMDALANGEEYYACDIVGGEPTLERLNPLKVRIYRSGYSSKIEDADVIIIEDYWSPGRIIDTFYDVLTKKDVEYIEKIPLNLGSTGGDELGNIDPRMGFVNREYVGEDGIDLGPDFINTNQLFGGGLESALLPFDTFGNVRVIRMYWKSRRKIKKIKRYNIETGQPEYNFYPETYKVNEMLGEEEEIFYINEAWEGTKIGQEVYVNMRPRLIQYNRMSNPSRCHFGIVGSIYNLNDSKPFSFVDIMKPYNYMYNVLHDRLNKMIARNWGKIISLDLAKVPKGWEIGKWMYYAKNNGIAVYDSFKEGNVGQSKGKLAGALNNNSTGVIDAEFGNSIQYMINLLEFIKLEMSEVVGITKQREGQISNRETVGGVERSNLQSSHITEWVFSVHEDVKKRALECFLETAKVAMKGNSKKFNYITSDNTRRILEIDGDEFANCDYGLIVDISQSSQYLNQKIDRLAEIALQNQSLSMSTITKLYSSCSMAEKTRMIETNELEIQQRQAEEAQRQSQMQQETLEYERMMRETALQQDEAKNIRDNETKILIAQMNMAATDLANDGIADPSEMTEKDREELKEKIRQFDATLKLENEKLAVTKDKNKKDFEVKKEQIRKIRRVNNG